MAKDMGAFDKKVKTEEVITKNIKGDLSSITVDGKKYPRGLSGPMETFGCEGGSTYPAASSEGSQTEIPSSSSTSGVESNYTSSVYGLLGGFG